MIPPVATNFVAGESIEAALDHVETRNDAGISGIVNLLGEHYADRRDAAADANVYHELASAIDRRGLDARISVKPSQIGLDVGADVFRRNLETIVDRATSHDVFVWIDMEDHTTTDVTIDAYERLASEYGTVGVCLQSNLKRTREDLERLGALPGTIRLVKGAYDEPASIAYTDRGTVNRLYRDQLAFMFEHFEEGIAVGSHDPSMIAHAIELHDEHGTPFEVQMLMGVREEAQVELAADGVDVYQYVPFGSKWASYFYRRVRERKENALFALRAVLGR
ncbi:MAG: proline dehydrogenase family protein [Halobacteriota archaeon]